MTIGHGSNTMNQGMEVEILGYFCGLVGQWSWLHGMVKNRAKQAEVNTWSFLVLG